MGRIISLTDEVGRCTAYNVCDDATELTMLKFLPPNSQTACGAFVCVYPHIPTPLNGRFDFLPYSKEYTDWMHLPRSDTRFDQVNTYYYATEALSTLSGGSAVIKQFMEGKWDPIKILLGVSNVCNAYWNSNERSMKMGVCRTSKGEEFSMAYDPSIPVHEAGHAIVSYANPLLADRREDIEGNAINEAVADLVAYIVTKDARIGKYFGRYLNNVSAEKGPGYLRTVDNDAVLTEATSVEEHDRSQPYSRFGAGIVTFLTANGVPKENALKVLGLIIEEAVPRMEANPMTPEDFVAAFIKATMALFEEGRLNGLLPRGFDRNRLVQSEMMSGLHLGLIRGMREPDDMQEFLQSWRIMEMEPQETPEISFEVANAPSTTSTGKALVHHRQIKKIRSQGNIVRAVVEGYGWSEFKYADRNRRVIASNVRTSYMDPNIQIPKEAAIRRISPQWIRSELLKQGLGQDTVAHVMAELVRNPPAMDKVLRGAEIAYIYNDPTPYHKFRFGPVTIYVNSANGSQLLGRTIKDEGFGR